MHLSKSSLRCYPSTEQIRLQMDVNQKRLAGLPENFIRQSRELCISVLPLKLHRRFHTLLEQQLLICGQLGGRTGDHRVLVNPGERILTD